MSEEHAILTREERETETPVKNVVTYYNEDTDPAKRRKCCMICNRNFEETCLVMELHCKHIFHQDCLNKMYNPVACGICCGDFVFNEATGKYDFQLQWSQRWEEMYGSLCVWMKDHLGERVKTVQIGTTLCEHHCTYADIIGAFVISPCSHGFKSLKALLDKDIVVILRSAVDGIFEATLQCGDGKLPIYDPMGMKIFGIVDNVLEEHEHHLTIKKALTMSLNKVASKVQSGYRK